MSSWPEFEITCVACSAVSRDHFYSALRGSRCTTGYGPCWRALGIKSKTSGVLQGGNIRPKIGVTAGERYQVVNVCVQIRKAAWCSQSWMLKVTANRHHRYLLQATRSSLAGPILGTINSRVRYLSS